MKSDKKSHELAIVASQNIEEKKYWLDKFSGELNRNYFPYDYNKRIKNAHSVDVLKSLFPAKLFSRTMELSKNSDVKLFVILAAGASLLLHKYTYNHQPDITVGTSIYRQKKDTRFINTIIAMHNFVKKDMTFKDFLIQVGQVIFEANKHQNYPLETLPHLLGVPLSEDGDFPLFDVGILLENLHDKQYLSHIHLNMIFIFKKMAQGIEVDVEYNTLLYKKATVERIISHFINLLGNAVFNVDAQLDDVDVLSENDKREILFDFNNTKAVYSLDKTMHRLFEEQVERTPGNTAVICDGKSMNYRELNEKANRLARQLRDKGVKPNSFVGVVMDRSLEMVMGVIAILKAGGAYVPVEPYLPDARIIMCLSSLNVGWVFTNRFQLSKIKKISEELPALPHIFCLDEEIEGKEEIGGHSGENPVPACASDIAYVIFTSGTTGTPKGVMEQHRPVVNIIEWVNTTCDVTDSDKLLFVASLSFDLSVYDIFGILASGGSIRVVENEDLRLPERLLDIIFREEITFWDSAPAALTQLVPFMQDVKYTGQERNKSKLRLVFLSGDWIPVTLPDILKKIFEGVKVMGLGGATEATIWSNFYPIEIVDPDWVSIPYGKPTQNAKYYILNQFLEPCPIGLPGDLYIGGECLALGYINDVELTAVKFINNPFVNGEKIYRTGDMARWFSDGNIEFLGRLDQQVKIRGFRIELGEIETQLVKHKDIKEAAVVVKTDEIGDKYLCAYIVATQEFPLSELRAYLSNILPDYMIPSYFMQIETIPITPNGKVHRKKLLEIQGKNLADDVEYMAPRNVIEETLVEIWQKVLGRERIGIYENYFMIGGDSIKSIQILSRMNEAGYKIETRELFQYPTISELAPKVKKFENTSKQSVTTGEIEKHQIDRLMKEYPDMEDFYNLTPMQEGMLFHALIDQSSYSYFMQTSYRLQGKLDIALVEKSLTELFKRHDILRTAFIYKDIERSIQVVLKDRTADFYYEDISKIGETEAIEKFIREFKDKDKARHFDLSKGALMRVAILQVNNSEFEFIWSFHHIVMDGWCLGILITEFFEIFHSYLENRPYRLPGVKPYGKYIQWLEKHDKKESARYWENYLDSLEEQTGVPKTKIINKKENEPQYRNEKFFFELSKERTTLLNKLAAGTQVTLSTVTQTIWAILLRKYSGKEDVIFGLVVSGRPSQLEGVESMMGLFINTIPVRVRFEERIKFNKLIRDVQEAAVESEPYHYHPLVEIQSGNALKQNLIDHLFIFENLPITEQIEGYERKGSKSDKFTLRVKNIEGFEQTNYDFNVKLIGSHELKITFLYNGNVYDCDFVERIAKHYSLVIDHVIENDGICIEDIDILSAEERNRLLYEFNNTDAGYPLDKTIHELFEEQVERTPDHISLIGPLVGAKYLQSLENANVSASPIIQLSYQELNESSNQLAYQLREKGVGLDSIVGLMVERSLKMIIGILGIMKAGGAYLPLDIEYPVERINFMLKDSGVSVLLTADRILENMPGGFLKNLNTSKRKPFITPARERILDFNSLPIPDRSLVNYEKYHKYISSAMVKHSISIQATRGCPFKCIYCNKICTGKFVQRSAEKVFTEIRGCYDFGIRRFTFIDDVFNLDEKNASTLLKTLIKNRMDVQLFFANGLRGDILSKEFIDLMVEAGAATICLALESGSQRLQKLMKKKLNLEKFRDNVHYITRKYPHIILELELIHGFPTETEAEAMETLDFLMDIKWVHFPDLHILKIYPHTDMYRLAVESGITEEQIARSIHLAYHEIPETLPFSKDFTRGYQAKFLSDYFFLKERLLQVLPYQMKILTEDELVQKYDSYLPYDIKSFSDILEYLGISKEELAGVELLPMENMSAPNFSQEIRSKFPGEKKAPNALRLLLLDLSLSFSSEKNSRLYDVVEAPLGLMYLLTYLNEKMEDQVLGKVLKSRIDFDSYEELKEIILDFKPDLIGIRTLSTYKEYFHRSVSLMRKWGVDVPIISGGPYATAEYSVMLQDDNVDLAVLGEGELTIAQLAGEMLKNNKKLPGDEVLKDIPGIAFIKSVDKAKASRKDCQILLVDKIAGESSRYPLENLKHINNPGDLAYLIYTSGSTGLPKGVMLNHGNLVNLIEFDFKYTNMDFNKILQFHTISFDASFHEIFSALLWGGQLILIDNEVRLNVNELLKVVARNRIKTLFLPMSFLKIIFSEEDYIKSIPRSVDHIQTAGEQVVINNAFNVYLKDNHVYLHNHYGPSETHVVTALTIEPDGDIPELPSIGKPVINTRIYILDKWRHLAPLGVVGEIWIGGVQVGRGYLNRPELTAEKFNQDLWDKKDDQDKNKSFFGGLRGRVFSKKAPLVYKTGDLGRWLPDGNIEFLVRMDHQVKIRGFRVEPGEIESRLLDHPGIKDAIVLASMEGSGDKYLCAYVVTDDINTISELREFLAKELPDYMIPSYVIRIEKIPLTPNNKVDRKALPDPTIKAGENHIAPRDKFEETLLELWSEVLNIEKSVIGIDSNFFQLGGHSLKATILIAKIFKEFYVKFPLPEVFKTPNIRGMAEYIKRAVKEKIISLDVQEKKEYYPISSQQKRLFFLQQRYLNLTAYNRTFLYLSLVELNKEKLELTFRKLMQRHESLRTSFNMVSGEIIQRIHHHTPFAIEYSVGNLNPGTITNFVRPFDLSQAPLFRVKITKQDDGKNMLMVDIHHIVSDGISDNVLISDFMTLYEGRQLPELKVQYKDFSQWQAQLWESGEMKKQEEYWLETFSGEIPKLAIPRDYPDSLEQRFEGSEIFIELDDKKTGLLKDLAKQENATLFMILLAIYNVLLAKLAGQEDIVVGTGVGGRRHADFENVIGMFVNTLALRNYPTAEKTFKDFLHDLRERTLLAFENQDYLFDELVEKVVPKSDKRRNPLFDTVFLLQNIEGKTKTDGKSAQPELMMSLQNLDAKTSIFDITMSCTEFGGRLGIRVSYSISIFKKETIEKYFDYYKDILSFVIENKELTFKLKDIRLSSGLKTIESTLIQEENGDFGF